MLKYKPYLLKDLKNINSIQALGKEWIEKMSATAHVLPTRVSNYAIQELIQWEDPLADSLFRLLIPQPEMLTPANSEKMIEAIRSEDSPKIQQVTHEIRDSLNPHPADQKNNIPHLSDGTILPGLQHKYRETVLFFPKQGQTCHSYCTFCFRFPQFVSLGKETHKFAMKEGDLVVRYLKEHPEISDILITGGDPMMMSTQVLERYLLPFLDKGLSHLQTIRIGTKSLTAWPYRFISDPDSSALLALLKRIGKAGKNFAFMAHINHPRELEPEAVKKAIGNIQETGAIIRSQSPLLRNINDDEKIWAKMWKEQVQLGIVPYYMFAARDTGAQHYFSLPLIQAWKIFSKAIRQVSGIARTVRGPSMSTRWGKIEVLGPTQTQNTPLLSLRMLQGRNPNWTYQPFFAEYDEKATWIDDLIPAFGQKQFFFAEEENALRN